MEIVVDLQTEAVTLSGPDDLKGFAVRVAGPAGASGDVAADRDRLAGALAAAGVGRIGGTGDAFVRPEAVRSLAAGQVGEDWAEGFAGMCAYAAGKGWIDEADGSIQAHVEWPAAGAASDGR